MLKLNIKDEDKIRAKDTQANEQRQFLQQTLYSYLSNISRKIIKF